MASLVVLKLSIAPLLLAVATLVARRSGPGAGGWLVGLPLTTGPVAIILVIQEGAPFVARLATGSLAGAAAQAGFALAYARLCRRDRAWPLALIAASAAFVATATALLAAHLWPPVLAACALASLPIAWRLAPAGEAVEPAGRTGGRLRLRLRMALAAALVVAITALAPLVGPMLAGVVTCFPLMGALLAVFAQREQGPEAAIAVCRGLLVGLVSFAGFALVLMGLLARLPVVAAFAVAIAATLTAQAASVRVVLV
jgi:fluoride ion exporter CrcB/FEX